MVPKLCQHMQAQLKYWKAILGNFESIYGKIFKIFEPN